jgi:hypothetical protein
MENKLENSLSVVKIWKILLKAGIRLYPDGFYRLNGIFGHSVTFGYLSITKEKMKMIRNHDGSLREPFLDLLAWFMCKQRPKMLSFSNGELVILGLTNLITSESSSKTTA